MPKMKLLLDCVDSKANLTVLLGCIDFSNKWFIITIVEIQVRHIFGFV